MRIAVTDWLTLDDGSFVRVDEYEQVVADVFQDEGDWFWVTNTDDTIGWALECGDPDIGKMLCDNILAEGGFDVHIAEA